MTKLSKINTFIIPTLNFQGVIKTLKSIRKHTPPNFNIILIDQHKEYLKEADEFVDLHIYTNGYNLGFAKAMNMGIRLADTKYVSCWNDDAECINKKWWDGVMETFKRYGNTALGVNPGSPRNPKASGAEPVNNMGIDHKEEFSEEDYSSMLEQGKGHIIDGICTFATVFEKEKLDLVKGSIPGQSWFDEYFYPGGGEDYSLNRQAYLTKRKENDFRGYRMLGTSLAYVWHHWYSTVSPKTGKAGVKHCGNQWIEKWGTDENGGGVDIYGKTGSQIVPMNTIRPLEDCK